ncbi:hypothetical protein C8J57DRAFT_1249753 [Mycena rebaudengoi]|nr:hypothetical protein C8J57DRAFT_1249753 [Mycena rebaudengoi]
MAASISGSCASHGGKSGGGLASMHLAKKKKLFELTAQVESLNAEIDTLKRNLVEVTNSVRPLLYLPFITLTDILTLIQEQKSVQKCEELTENNKELTVALSTKPVAHADLQRQCEELAEKNQELIMALKKKPAPPPSGPSAAVHYGCLCDIHDFCLTIILEVERALEEAAGAIPDAPALLQTARRLKTELQELKEAHRGFVFVDLSSMQVDI